MADPDIAAVLANIPWCEGDCTPDDCCSPDVAALARLEARLDAAEKALREIGDAIDEHGWGVDVTWVRDVARRALAGKDAGA